MKFSNVVRDILSSSLAPMTPQEIRNEVKVKHPDLYGTSSHLRNVEKGYYIDIDHALLAQIYSLVGTSGDFLCDKSEKPMKISLAGSGKPQSRPTVFSASAPTSGFPHEAHGGTTRYDEKTRQILENAEIYHDAYYKAETFRGPSLYFHERALATRHDPVSLTHLEYVYATLASWGMHRMGAGGSKMQNFKGFFQSVQGLQGRIAEAQTFNFLEMTDISWAVLREIFCRIKVMATGTTLVGNSKVMHHMLPNIIPPIDREYTLRFLRGNTFIKNNLETEWFLMRDIISKFFIPVASDSSFRRRAERWLARGEVFPWDTSIFKVVDNLVIGSKK